MSKPAAINYEVLSDDGYVHVTGTGQLSMPAMIDTVDAIAEDPAFCSDYSVIFDLRDADYEAELSDGDAFIKALTRRKEQYGNRFALVVPAHLLFLAKLYSVLASTGGFDRMSCFTDIDAAREWCGLN